MRHEYLSVYNLKSDTINVDTINVGGGGYLTKTHNFATDGHVCASHTLFNISGVVRFKIIPVCITSLAGGGVGNQVSLGYNGAATAIIAETTGTQIDAGEIWMSSVDAAIAKEKATSLVLDRVAAGYTTIRMQITSASTSTGKIQFHLWWEPILAGSKVTVA